MKKGLLIAFVLIVAGLAALSSFTGKIFNGQLEQLLAELEKDPRLAVLESQKQSGWFNSQGDFTLAYQMDADNSFVLAVNWQAKHWPGWADFTGQSGLQLQNKQTSFDLLQELGVEALAFNGSADWKEFTYHMNWPAMTFAENSFQFAFSGGQLEGSYTYSGEQQSTFFQAERLSLADERQAARLDLEQLHLSWNQEGLYPWVSGQMAVNLERIIFNGPLGEITFAQPSLNQQLDFTEKNFGLSLQFASGDIRSSQQKLGTASLSLETADFSGQAMADLLRILGQEGDWNQLNARAQQTAQEALSELLTGSPRLLLQDLDVQLTAPIKFSQQAEGELQFDGRNLPVNYITRLSRGEIMQDDFIKRLRLELFFSQLNPQLLQLLGLPPELQDETAEQQVLLWEGGELRLNGQRLPF